MAELIDVLASVLESTAAFGDFDEELKGTKRLRLRWRNLLVLVVLTCGKAADITT